MRILEDISIIVSSNIQDLSLQRLAQSFTSEGWIVLVLSLSGALTRLTLFEVNVSIIDFVRRILSAIVVGILMWIALDVIDSSQLYKIIIYIVIGLDSPSIIRGILTGLSIFAKNPLGIIGALKRIQIIIPESEKPSEKPQLLKPRQRQHKPTKKN